VVYVVEWREAVLDVYFEGFLGGFSCLQILIVSSDHLGVRGIGVLGRE
jgi:hypothetical protein